MRVEECRGSCGLMDLHVHTSASDGEPQPMSAGACEGKGLSIVAITDHYDLLQRSMEPSRGTFLIIEPWKSSFSGETGYLRMIAWQSSLESSAGLYV